MNSVTRRLGLILLAAALITGCAGRAPPDSGSNSSKAVADNKDPFEPFNRAMFKLNDFGDKYLFRPVARTYRNVLPRPVRTGVYNFFENLNEPVRIVNSLLQGNAGKAGTSTVRLGINTVFGFAGLLDIASEVGFKKAREDLGQTFGVWGIPSGPYLVLPIFGPRNTRSFVGLLGDSFLYPPWYLEDDAARYGITAIALISSRARLLGTETLLELQLDPYVFLRESYRQQREAMIRDDKQQTGFDDEFNDEFDDEFNDEPEQEFDPATDNDTELQ